MVTFQINQPCTMGSRREGQKNKEVHVVIVCIAIIRRIGNHLIVLRTF